MKTVAKEQEEKAVEIFKKAMGNENAQVKVESMSADELPVTIVVPEFMRRMQEMAQMQGMPGMGDNLPGMEQVAVNGNHSFISKVLDASEEEQVNLAKQAYDLALLSQGMLSGADLTAFIKRSVSLLG